MSKVDQQTKTRTATLSPQASANTRKNCTLQNKSNVQQIVRAALDRHHGATRAEQKRRKKRQLDSKTAQRLRNSPRGAPRIVPTLRAAAFAVMAQYVSPVTGKQGVEAFLYDVMTDDPKFFLTQVVRIEPRALSVDTTSRSYRVVMQIDGALPSVDAKPVNSRPVLPGSDTSSAT